MDTDKIVRECRESVKAALGPLVGKSLQAAYGTNWQTRCGPEYVGQAQTWDLQALLKAMIAHWHVFDGQLPRGTRSLVHEMKDWRNHVAHERAMTPDDLFRLVDTALRLVRSVDNTKSAGLQEIRSRLMLALAPEPHLPASSTRASTDHVGKYDSLADTRSGPTPDVKKQVHVNGAPPWSDCLMRIALKLDVTFSIKTGRCALTSDAACGVCCLVSKQHANDRYWWNLRERQLVAISSARAAYVALACGTPDTILLVPLANLREWTPMFNPKPGEDGAGWHVHVECSGRRWSVLLQGRGNKVDVTRFLIT
ncbi:MAG: Swt1 family HEPN domain-containing protein [Armatimonadetes bacterium]|nr:Swt1 family HEPN domain-containing protein [Armatimonadota bacterium]